MSLSSSEWRRRAQLLRTQNPPRGLTLWRCTLSHGAPSPGDGHTRVPLLHCGEGVVLFHCHQQYLPPERSPSRTSPFDCPSRGSGRETPLSVY